MSRLKEKPQIQRMYEYLLTNIATASMLEEALNIKQKCITRYKRELENNGYLYEIYHQKCKETGFKAWYLSTDPYLNPMKNQLKFSFYV